MKRLCFTVIVVMATVMASLNCQEGERIPSYLEVQGTELKGCRNNWEYVSSNVKIPNGITIIGKRAFKGFRTLVSIEIPASVRLIEHEAFSGCDSLREIRYGGTKEQWWWIIEKHRLIGVGFSRSIVIHCMDGDFDYEDYEPDIPTSAASASVEAASSSWWKSTDD